jgi:hypothetical protein
MTRGAGAVSLRVRLLRLIGVAAAVLHCGAAVAQQITFTMDGVSAPSFAAGKISGTLRAGDAISAEVQIGEIELAGHRWRNVRIRCPDLKQERDQLSCAQGTLESPAKMPLEFRYSTLTKKLEFALHPVANESWRVSVSAAETFTLTLANVPLTRLAPWWPAAAPRPNAGVIGGTMIFTDAAEPRISAELKIAGFGFSDDSGLHAGEKIAAVLALQAQQRAGAWQWQSRIEWQGGDVFWQPIFVSGGGHILTVAGLFDAKRVLIERGRLAFAGVGNFEFSARYDIPAARLAAARLDAANLDVTALYEKLLKSMLQGTVLGDMRSDGRTDVAIEIRDGTVATAEFEFKRVSFEDRARRFALFGVSGALPWHREQSTVAILRIDGGEVLHMPFGAFALPLEMRGMSVRTRDLHIPLLDGKLIANEFLASEDATGWRWRYSGSIAPISMQRFTGALGLPVMHGTLSAEIPAVRYQQSTLAVDGALLFKVFDGTITAQKLVLESPFGKVPRLTADVEMRNLDLDLLTRTFSFGKMTGRVDAQVRELELVNWEPVRFDARIASSPGNYPRRISQAAVQNISALGGAGAAAAIQRSFLRFFETFGYSALGLSCRLEAGVCQMGGIENVPQGYVLVKGGGVPAINVMGYNRNVGWRELIERLKRVTEGNVIVK